MRSGKLILDRSILHSVEPGHQTVYALRHYGRASPTPRGLRLTAQGWRTRLPWED